MRVPFILLEGRKIPRLLFSIPLKNPREHQKLLFLMKRLYEEGFFCLDLPTPHHLQRLKELRELTEDENLIGCGHIGIEDWISFLGKPIDQFELKIISTLIKNFIPRDWIKKAFPKAVFGEVLTQKEINRMTFDSSRFNEALSFFHPGETPFLLLRGKYNDWLLTLGRIDLFQESVSMIRERGFIPLLSLKWPTFLLPKAKPLEVAAYVIPIHPKKSLFDFYQTCDMVKKFDKPIIGFTPFMGSRGLKRSKVTFSFLFNDLKIHLTVVEVSSEIEIKRVLKGVSEIPHPIHSQRTLSVRPPKGS